MANETGIEWTDSTFNPWWECVKVSKGCDNCYAEKLSNRYGHKAWGPNSERRFLSENNWKQPEQWNRKAAEEGERRSTVTKKAEIAAAANLMPTDSVIHQLWSVRCQPQISESPARHLYQPSCQKQHACARLPKLLTAPSMVRRQ